MTEPHLGGYRCHDRDDVGKRDPADRVEDFEEIWAPEWDAEDLRDQGERCMDCGVATCTGGCPIGNAVPDWNDLVYRDDWKAALQRLHATNNFPEFTGYTCPAPCEDACVLAYNDDPVAIKSIERAIVDRGWAEGWIEPDPPEERTGYEVAVVGSGPAGMAAAQQLNRAGHRVTVFERDEVAGGLMVLGIPDFKFGKDQVRRRVEQLEDEGIEVRTNAEVGGNVPAATLTENFDAAVVAVGAQAHRDLDLPGRDLDGVHLAMPYFRQANRRQAGRPIDGPTIDADGADVVVLGGGDTGADCVATAHRQGAEQVVQVDINHRPPDERPPDNPWPEAPQSYEETYAQAEGGEEGFALHTRAFLDEDGDGRVDAVAAERVRWTYDDAGDRTDREVVDPDRRIPADLALIAVGFEGAEAGPFADLGVERDADGTLRTDEDMMTTAEGVFAAGDANLGATLVVWAIGDGRDVARNVDAYLTGDTDLPPSLRTANPPIEPVPDD